MFLPVTGHPLHTRSMTLKAVAADKGRWSARGDIIDLRKTGFAPLHCDLQPAGIIHHMSIDLLVDPATLVVEALVAAQPVVAVELSPRSCGESCRDPVGILDSLVGTALDGDFRGKLSRAFGGPRGCSHLLSLFQFMARAIDRAVSCERHYNPEPQRSPGEIVFQSSLFVDGYQTPQRHFELALQLSDYLVRPEPEVDTALSRFQYDEGARVFARVDTADMSLADVRAATRARDVDSLGEDWIERDEWAARLAGRAIAGGLGGFVAAAYADEPEARVLQDGLAQLAPGYIQILAAVADQWIAHSTGSNTDEAEKPLGGHIDSCYIWREGGRAHGP
ncbi:MAG: DUF2889 domain-containing protein [Halioglobus sp.]|nr:DUF2889 domain-containing protein [Halioglobus sp.]